MTAQAHSPVDTNVLATVRNHVGHLTLNRPAGLNALTLPMVRQLQQQLDAWLGHLRQECEGRTPERARADSLGECQRGRLHAGG